MTLGPRYDRAEKVRIFNITIIPVFVTWIIVFTVEQCIKNRADWRSQDELKESPTLSAELRPLLADEKIDSYGRVRQNRRGKTYPDSYQRI